MKAGGGLPSRVKPVLKMERKAFPLAFLDYFFLSVNRRPPENLLNSLEVVPQLHGDLFVDSAAELSLWVVAVKNLPNPV